MSQSSDNLAVTEPSVMWQLLSERIDALVAAWEASNQPPDLAEFIPTHPPTLRRLTLVEAIKVDLEYRWQDRKFPKLIEAYVNEFPELAAEGGVPSDVIYEEYHVRKQRGDAVSLVEYCERFPERVEEFQRLFELESPEQTSSLVQNERAPTLEAGQQIDDFDLLTPLGKGAFASVFLARQRSMHRLVALKVSCDRGTEPQTLAQLDHPNIVRVFDQRQMPAHKLRLLYMQYVAGGTLKDVVDHIRTLPAAARNGQTLLDAIDATLKRHGEEPPGDSLTRHRLKRASWAEAVCWMGSRLASALSYAHDHGVLHRDVKPANVLVGADGQPKLADFNISFSKLDGATPAAYFGGSLAYMSPEQLEACDPAQPRQPGDLDGRSDVYSLAVLLWELLTGRRPFPEDGLQATWSKVLPKMTAMRRAGVPAEAMALLPPGCPSSVVDVLKKCLSPEADDRYPSAAALARELDLCLKPRAHSLLHGRSPLRSVIRRYPVTTMVAIGLLPNIVLSILNIAYNWQGIVHQLGSEEQRVFFRSQILVVNSVMYFLGLGYIIKTRGPVLRTLSRLAGGRPAAMPSDDMLRKCLTLGSAVTLISVLLWGISGFIFPGWMRYRLEGGHNITPEHFRHFVVSNMLCGVIAATQSYYVVTFLTVRYTYPWLLQARALESVDAGDLTDLLRRGRVVLGITLSIPFIALTAVVLLNFDRLVIGALGGVGLVGCGLAYLLDLSIRSDAAALAAAMNPGGDTMFGETGDSFLSGSRR